MARIGTSVTKATAFRNSTQEFSNVYYYESTSGGHPNQTDADGILDTIVNREKGFHSAAVTFIRARLWSQVGTEAQNEMILQKNLSGSGSLSALSDFDRERAYLIRIRAGVDVRGQPVYLRKWYHAIGAIGGVALSAAILAQTAGFLSAQRTTIENAVANILTISQGGQTWELCSKSGRPFNVPAQLSAHQFLEHHQLGDMWRAQ